MPFTIGGVEWKARQSWPTLAGCGLWPLRYSFTLAIDGEKLACLLTVVSLGQLFHLWLRIS